MKIKYVAQRQKKDCMLACLAMILNIEYNKLHSMFWRDFDKTGLELEIGRDFLADSGFNIIEKRNFGFDVISNARKEMWKPFAPIHLVKVRQWLDRQSTHAIVMDGKGKIYDPGYRTAKKNSYYEVISVVGCFPSKTIKI